MDIVEIGPWVIQLESNQKEIDANSLCSCLYCLNFYHAVLAMDYEEVKTLKKLGICPSKPIHLSYFGETEFKCHLYSGSYHLQGTLLAGKPVRNSEWLPLNLISIGKIKFVISNEVNFVPMDTICPYYSLILNGIYLGFLRRNQDSFYKGGLNHVPYD